MVELHKAELACNPPKLPAYCEYNFDLLSAPGCVDARKKATETRECDEDGVEVVGGWWWWVEGKTPICSRPASGEAMFGGGG